MASPAARVPTVIIGGGHAGLAMSRRLSQRSIRHVVLERGEVANSWRTERWDSLRLLTPNWQSRLPGMDYCGDDPDGYMTMPEVTDFIAAYATKIAAPVHTRTTVTRVSTDDRGYVVETDQGTWLCTTVVIASGGSNMANVPKAAADVPTSVDQVNAMTYQSPNDLDDRPVLVVGASATGVQLADEISRAGRAVVISVGEHVRMPRIYRGRDVFWWMHSAGILDERYDEVDDVVRARHLPSPQLIGTPDHRSIDLNALTDRGVEIVGRLGGVSDGIAQFSGSLANVCKLADLKMNRLLQSFDDWAEATGVVGVGPAERFVATRVPSPTRLELGFIKEDIGTVVWATGYRPDYSWLDVPVLDVKGRVLHDGGVTDAPGLYVTGLNVLRRRRSSFINGADRDSEDLSEHLARHLELGQPCAGRQRLGVCDPDGLDLLARSTGLGHSSGSHRLSPPDMTETTLKYEFTTAPPIPEADALAKAEEMGLHPLAFDVDLSEDEELHWHEFAAVVWVISGEGRFTGEDGVVMDVRPGCRLQAPAGWLHRNLAGPAYRVVLGSDLPGDQWTTPINKDPAERPASLAVQ